ncbi:hypothetical protein AAG747_27575 [Rapidithrix thailandica]|uniref:Uncharacterized protein n=1 Tax=Rapidithrix thailandica TaxID=413964 RepID=A0AAW9SE98_9BACT
MQPSKNGIRRLVVALVFITLLLPLHVFANGKGFFAIQFTWDNGSYNPEYKVGVNFTKGSIISKNFKEITAKNNILIAEFSPGDYEIESLEFTGGDLYGQKLTLDFKRKITIEDGKITNGGLVFIGKGSQKNKKRHEIYFLTLNNQADLQWYLQNKYVSPNVSRTSPVQTAWEFTKQETIDRVIAFFEKSYVERETQHPQKGVKYLYGMLGMLIKLQKDQNGTVVGSQRLHTGTYRQVQSSQSYQGKKIVDLGQGHYLYGPDEDLQPVKYPEGLTTDSQFKFIGNNKFLVVDGNFNIYVSEGKPFQWKKQDDFHRKYDPYNRPHISFGANHIYIFTYHIEDDWSLLRAPYDKVQFEAVEISPEIKKVSEVQETQNKLVIGPRTTNFVKKGAFIHVQDLNSGNWELVRAPRGDCGGLYVDSKNDNRFQAVCGKLVYISEDAGHTWVLIKDKK